MKNSTNTILLKRPELQEVDNKIPEKMRMNQAIKYLENVITAYENFTRNEEEAIKDINKFELTKMFENIPTVLEESKWEDSKENSSKNKNNDKPKDDTPFSMDLHNKAVEQRYKNMTKSAYLLLVYSYLLLGNCEKAKEYCQSLRSDFKLNSKMNFEVKMYMAEICLMQGHPDKAFTYLKIDQAFEERKENSEDSHENFVNIENTWSGFVEKELPKRAVMFLNIATCNYLLNIPDEARDAISNALDCLGFRKEEANASRKLAITEIPEYLLHSLVYLNLFNGDEDTALKLLRKRRFDKNNDDLLNFSTTLGPLKVFK